MTRPHLIAKLIFFAIGVCLVIYILDYIYSFSFNYSAAIFKKAGISPLFITAAVGIVPLAASLILLFWSERLARLLTDPDAPGCEKVDGYQSTAAFRSIACFCGLLILYTPVSHLIGGIPAVITGPNILSYLTFEGQSSLLSAKSLTRIFVGLTKGVIGLYLAFGAPHYVRWQTKLAIQTNGAKP